MTASSYGSKLGVAARFTKRHPMAIAPDVVAEKGNAHIPSTHSVSSFDTAKKTVSCTPQWLNDNIDRVWRQLDQCKSDPDGRYAPDDDPYDESDDPVNDERHVETNVYRYQFKNGEMTEVESDDDTIDIDLEETENSTDDDIDAILDCRDIEMVKNTNKTEKIQEEKLEVLSFRSFSPFDDMGWSFSAESSAKSISDIIEKEVIYPILKPICELVEATEIPGPEVEESRRPRKTTISYKNSSYRMSPRRPKSSVMTKM
jgi:hypothetical protein